MPKAKRTVKKRIRQNLKKRLRNKSLKSTVRTQIKKFQKLIETGNLESAKQELSKTMSTIDKTSQKGVMHDNTAARKKSQLHLKFNELVEKAAAAN